MWEWVQTNHLDFCEASKQQTSIWSDRDGPSVASTPGEIAAWVWHCKKVAATSKNVIGGCYLSGGGLSLSEGGCSAVESFESGPIWFFCEGWVSNWPQNSTEPRLMSPRPDVEYLVPDWEPNEIPWSTPLQGLREQNLLEDISKLSVVL